MQVYLSCSCSSSPTSSCHQERLNPAFGIPVPVAVRLELI
ncbi:hypothetical protein VD0003_g8182 [Verticillium dahliae]|nr:hypothetical protein VD0003_g8182 [Verticillium dahliae]